MICVANFAFSSGLRDAFLAYYEAGLADTTRLFDGIDELLTALERRSLHWGVVTNKAERFTWPVLTVFGPFMLPDHQAAFARFRRQAQGIQMHPPEDRPS